MILNSNNVQFESRYEIDTVIVALEKFLNDNPNYKDYSEIKELKDKLVTMWFWW